ncbi:MAG: alpha/beta fold hydrolase [Deltaproteobacteria bacterium]
MKKACFVLFVLLFVLSALPAARAQSKAPNWPAPKEGDYTLWNFRFEDGESLPEVRMHYRTLGTPHKNAAGIVDNAVLVLHGTTGSGAGFLVDHFAGMLFVPGGLLDASKYYIILPDDIGHGHSTKPSDGLHARFPHYDYHDMVRAENQLVTEGLGVNHLRLVMGTSMGAMHTWMWGEMYPEFVQALMPLACLPVQISGRNRMMRDMIMHSIRDDPDWKNGEYTTQPRGLDGAIYIMMVLVSSPSQWQKEAPTQQAADAMFDRMLKRYREIEDANDMLYAFDASRDYNPEPELEKITAPLIAVNSADDQVNPPELDIVPKLIGRVKRGKFVLIPISDQTRGHGTHSYPAVWGNYLKELLQESK